MAGITFPNIDQSIARCRLVLSGVALVAVFLDPTHPIMLSRWIPLTGGRFTIDPYARATLVAHLLYSVLTLYVLAHQILPAERVTAITTWCDVVFGAAIAVFTEGVTSPFYAFFAFAVLEAGLSTGLRRTMLVTAVSVGLYLSLILVSGSGKTNWYIMRPIYLGITGYLVGYLGQQRLNLEAGIRELAAAHQRQRIARDLHDGRAQALAGINLRLESCRELLRRGRNGEALEDLAELQASVNREYDELRTYMRSLVGLEATVPVEARADTCFRIDMQLDGSAALIEQVLQILREGVTNVLRHAQARLASIRVHSRGPEVLITLDDDGIGLADPLDRPWSIASRVSDLGGTICVQDRAPGAHLAITLPLS